MGIKNKSAFPHPDKYDSHTGLTKREYFAIEAMKGILSKHGLPESWNKDDLPDKAHSAIEASVILAEELLKELEK